MCVPTAKFGSLVLAPRFPRCLLVVGEAPGLQEDRACKPFVGPSGRMLQEVYLDLFDFDSQVDIYLTNAVRCRVPSPLTPTATQLKACQGYLLSDVRQLQAHYEEVIILAVGASALKALTGLSLRKWSTQQGEHTDFTQLSKTKKDIERLSEVLSDRPKPCRVFATYHPSYLMRPNGAQMGLAVHSHLTRLQAYLNGEDVMDIEGALEIAIAPAPPSYPIERLALDIETYGFFANAPPQRHFHPAKMTHYDGVPKSKIIYSTGLTWRDEAGVARHAIFEMQNGVHRRRLWSWLRKATTDPAFKFLLGHNLCFDLSCLRYCYPECKAWLDHPLPLMDTIITNSLYDEGRPEKSLKNLAPLHGITRYEAGGEDRKFLSASDPLLHQYNCQDTYATLLLQEKLEDEVRGFYGQDTQKFSPFCHQWYSQLLWLIIWMTETGVCMDQPLVERIFRVVKQRHDSLILSTQEQWGFPLQGKGSDKAKRLIIDEALAVLRAAKVKLPELELTTKTRAVSFSVKNRNTLIDALKAANLGAVALAKLTRIGGYQDNSKLLTSYLYPLLVGRGAKHTDQSTCLIGGTCYPKWFPVPSEYEDGKTGGTKQSRLACSGPSIPTFPPLIKWPIVGRFRPGFFIWSDYSQIEFRIAALLSNDPVMMEEYRGTPDLHTRTAKIIFGDSIVDHPEFKSKYRQAGKALNFLVLFRGGAAKFQETLMRNIGIDYPINKCHEAIAAFRATYPGLWAWQESVIEFVKEHEYFELPLIGNSRLFLGGQKIREASVNEIVNIPIQAVAAVITQSAQFDLWSEFKRCRLRSIVPINIYDAVAIEGPKTEKHIVSKIMLDVLPNPWYYQALTAHLGRSVPLGYEIKEKSLG